MKKGMLFFLSFLVIATLFLSGCGTAASGSSGLSNIDAKATFQNIVTLQFLGPDGLNVIQNTIDPLEGFIRFLLLIAIILLLYKGATAIGLNNYTALGLSAILSLVVIIFTPTSIIIGGGVGYGTIFSLLFLGLPVGLLFAAYYFLKDHHIMRFICMVFAILVLYTVDGMIAGFASGVGGTVGTSFGAISSFFTWVIVLAWALAVISLLSIMSNWGRSSAHHPNGVKRLWNRMSQRLPLVGSYTEKGKELRHAQIEKTRLLSDVAAEEEQLKDIKEAISFGKDYKLKYTDIDKHATKDVLSKVQLDSMKASYNKLKNVMDTITKTDMKRFKRAERREVREMTKLQKELAKKGVKQSVIDKMGADSQLILGQFSVVLSEVRSAKTAINKVKKGQSDFYTKVNGGAAYPFTCAGNPAETDLNAIKKHTNALMLALGKAKKAEELALAQTIALANYIKDNWVV
jgi:hypothetical protein